MAVSFGTYYINAETFSQASTVFSDSGMTIVATDGVYQFGGVYRNMTNGILGPPTTCMSCCAPCGASTTYTVSAEKNRINKVCSHIGAVTNAAIIVKFTFSGAPLGYPLGFESIFNGTSYTGVISNRFGWLPNKYVGNNVAILPSDLVNDSPYNLEIVNWVPLVGVFQNTNMSETETIELSDINVNTQNNPDICYMVIPKNVTIDTIEARVYSPKPTGTSGGGAEIAIKCPTTLRSFTTSTVQADITDACGAGSGVLGYHVQVNGVSGAPRLYDRVFVDSAGVATMNAGYYWIPNTLASPSSSGWMRVDSDGIVQATGVCASGIYTALTQVTSAPRRVDIPTACSYAMPDETYWHDGSNDAPVALDVMYEDELGTTPLANGFYQLLREYALVEITGGLGVVNTVTYCS